MEFTLVALTAAYIPQHTDSNQALDELYEVMEQTKTHTAAGCWYCGLVILTGLGRYCGGFPMAYATPSQGVCR